MIHEVYVTVHRYAGECGPVLRCVACPEWEIDIDGMALAAAVKRSAEHEREAAGKDGAP